MTDALISLVIVLAAAIPVAGVINYAYYSVVSSADISVEFNKFGDGVDNQIWNHMHDTASALPLNKPSVSLTGTSFDLSGLPGVTFKANGTDVPADIVAVKGMLNSGGSRRHVQAEVFMIRRRP